MKPPVLLYGHPPPALFSEPAGAIQVSPLEPAGQDLSAPPVQDFASALILAPPGRLEREWVLARVLQLLPPGAEVIALAPNDRGGPRIARSLVERLGLTSRQTDVLAGMVRGLPNKLIARELGLSTETVKVHVASVLRALNVSTRTQAIVAVTQMQHEHLAGFSWRRGRRG